MPLRARGMTFAGDTVLRIIESPLSWFLRAQRKNQETAMAREGKAARAMRV